ncbi:MAG: dephospho-CoA kinase [Clostridia bacterium]|nr:dephospho-CoA kinase [Clostridia bacterium]
MKIGLTGSSGSGKSTVAAMFLAMGYKIVDCDKISREIDSLPEYKAAVRKNFGNGAFDDNGGIDRRALGMIVFGNDALLAKLTEISHPIIIARVMEEIEKCGNADVVIDAPLLFESGLDKICDTTIGVVASAKLRARRVSRRDGITVKDAARRVSFQKSIDFYKMNCIHIIENNGTTEELEKKFAAVAEKMKPGRKKRE